MALAREVVQVSRRGRALRLSARRRRIVGVAAALVIVPGTAVAAGQFVARTGVFGHPGKTEEDTSEWINVCARDFPALVRSLPRPTHALPPGSTWDAVTEEVVRRNVDGVGQGCHGTASMVQEGTLRADFEFAGQMRWTCRALAEHTAGHGQAGLTAAREVAASYDRLAAAGQFADTNWKPLRDAAQRGDFAALQNDARVNYPSDYCSAVGAAR